MIRNRAELSKAKQDIIDFWTEPLIDRALAGKQQKDDVRIEKMMEKLLFKKDSPINKPKV